MNIVVKFNWINCVQNGKTNFNNKFEHGSMCAKVVLKDVSGDQKLAKEQAILKRWEESEIDSPFGHCDHLCRNLPLEYDQESKRRTMQ
jgi:hypothetical protein